VGAANGHSTMGNDRDNLDQRSPGRSRNSTGSHWCLRRTEQGGLGKRQAIGVEALSWRRRQRHGAAFRAVLRTTAQHGWCGQAAEERHGASGVLVALTAGHLCGWPRLSALRCPWPLRRQPGG
jgi:hypothetical protein